MDLSLLIYGAAAAIAVLGLVVRRRTTGTLPRRRFWIATLVSVAATVVGTIVNISGVLLALVAGIPVAWAILTDRWRIGDTGLLLTILGFSTGGAYLLAAAIDPDTGSFADQGAAALAILGAFLSIIAIAWALIRNKRDA